MKLFIPQTFLTCAFTKRELEEYFKFRYAALNALILVSHRGIHRF